MAELIPPPYAPKGAEALPDSCIFHAEKPRSLQEVFFATAVDILLTEPDSHVYYFVPARYSEDPLFLALRSVSRFHPVYHPGDWTVLWNLAKELAGSHNRFYIFAEEVERCIPCNEWSLLQDMIASRAQNIRVCLSTRFHVAVPSNVWAKPLSRDMITIHNGSPCLLVPSPDLPAKMQKLLQNSPKPRKPRKNTPPTLTQIILAVTAALLAFIASQLRGG